MANPSPSGDPVDDPADDPLALFGPETNAPAAAPASKTGTAPAKPASKEARPAAKDVRPATRAAEPAKAPTANPDTIYPTPSVLKKMAAEVPRPTQAPRGLAVEVVGPAPSAGAISFDRICSVKGLGFVEGVALIQSTCEALAGAGRSAGVPELHGLFLRADGKVVLHGPPTGEPPARELALLLHQLVAPNLMPPAGRLFVGRWINNESPDLTEFTSELAYFARPNGREILTALHSRCESARPPAQVHRLEPRHRQTAAPQPAAAEPPPASMPASGFQAWLRFHKPEVFVAVVVLFAVTATAIATLLSNPSPAQAKPPIDTAENVTAQENAGPIPASSVERQVPPAPASGRNGGSGVQSRGNLRSSGASDSSVPNRRTAVVPSSLARRRTPEGQPSTVPIESQNAARSVPPEALAAVLPSRQTPDLRIYSASDGTVEPPRLRSAEIPELLIAGFEKRINRVELVISERGEVQQARMIGPPQRMPDIMLLSRAKELLFDPAIRNGVPVRYRLILSWNVTP